VAEQKKAAVHSNNPTHPLHPPQQTQNFFFTEPCSNLTSPRRFYGELWACFAPGSPPRALGLGPDKGRPLDTTPGSRRLGAGDWNGPRGILTALPLYQVRPPGLLNETPTSVSCSCLLSYFPRLRASFPLRFSFFLPLRKGFSFLS
jgi:hypothetical protein